MEKIDKILKLADLGYSRVEIEKLLGDVREAAKETVDDGGGQMIDILAEEKTVETPIDDAAPKDERISNLETSLQSIEETLKNIQSQNVRWSNMPDSVAKPKTELEIVQDILGGFKRNGNE